MGWRPSRCVLHREVLEATVLYHILEGEVLPGAALPTAGEVTTAGGQPLFLSGDPNLATSALEVAGMGSTARVLAPDYLTGCGWVVHGIDTVLLPIPGPNGTTQQYTAQLAASG